MATLSGVNPELVRRFMAMQRAASQAGFNIGVTSGYRTMQQQINLRKSNGCADVWTAKASTCRIPTAIPGSSNHNHGLAIDISGSKAAKAWANANGARFGLHFPVSGEDWHVEMIGDNGSYNAANAAMQRGAIGFDMNWQDKAADPMDELTSRLDSITRILSGGSYQDVVATPEASEVATPGAPEVATPGPAAMPQQIRTEDVTVGGGQPSPGQARLGAVSAAGWKGGIPPAGYTPPGTGAGRWAAVARAALQYTNQPESYLPLLLRRLNQESGGNPYAINNWDSNAQRGDPSKGLMQNIGSAFPGRAGELAGRGIYDGFANIVASIRYTLRRYGSLDAWGKKGGY